MSALRVWSGRDGSKELQGRWAKKDKLRYGETQVWGRKEGAEGVG